MTDDMTIARARALAAAYGGDIARWPAAERAAASRLADDPATRAILAEAVALDEMLDGWAAPVPGAALRGAILSAAPRGGEARRLRLWWSAVGVAAALGGAAAGSMAAAAAAPALPGEEATAFGDLGGPEG